MNKEQNLNNPQSQLLNMKELKEGVFIEGFGCENQLCDFLIKDDFFLKTPNILYQGKTSEISEELSETLVEYNSLASMYLLYDSYRYSATTAKRSIRSAACKENGFYEYIIIWRNEKS